MIYSISIHILLTRNCHKAMPIGRGAGKCSLWWQQEKEEMALVSIFPHWEMVKLSSAVER